MKDVMLATIVLAICVLAGIGIWLLSYNITNWYTLEWSWNG